RVLLRNAWQRRGCAPKAAVYYSRQPTCFDTHPGPSPREEQRRRGCPQSCPSSSLGADSVRNWRAGAEEDDLGVRRASVLHPGCMGGTAPLECALQNPSEPFRDAFRCGEIVLTSK